MRYLFYSLLAIVPALQMVCDSNAAYGASDWTSDWAVEKDFSISIDTEGYDFPTAIAFVPNPGTEPKDPLYFITEIRGKIKVVTNDRSIHVFAEDFSNLSPEAELPSTAGEMGLAGICLDAMHGYVFVTYVYQDTEGVMRNTVTRFESMPVTFSTQPTGRLDFTEIFSSDRTALAHQIGPCQVVGDSLYVSVGDGYNHMLSRSIDSTLGKILRMTLDGDPHPDNPFHRQETEAEAASYVWAYGLRNPFSLQVVNGRVFVADNGLNTDRFLEVHEGGDYFWNGTDWSIGMRADMVFSPAVAPVQMEYYPENLDLFPRGYRARFYVAAAGDVKEIGPGEHGRNSILTFPYDFERGRVADLPEIFLRYRGDGRQSIVGLGLGPDGLYFVPLFPDVEGRSAVFRVVYDPAGQHPFLVGEDDPRFLMGRYGCLGCHVLDGVGNDLGPALDRDLLVPRIASRLSSEVYRETLRRLERSEFAPLQASREAVTEILRLEGTEQVRAWIIEHIQNPGFDNPASQMPDLNLSITEAAAITSYLVPERGTLAEIEARIRALLGRPRIRALIGIDRPVGYRNMGLSFAVGFVLGVVSAAFLVLIFWLARRSGGRGSRRPAQPVGRSA